MDYNTYLQWKRKRKKQEQQLQRKKGIEVMQNDSSQLFRDTSNKPLKDILTWD